MRFRRSSVTYLVLFVACLVAGVLVQSGGIGSFLDYRALALICVAFVLLLFLSGGPDGGAKAYFDAFTVGASQDDLERDRLGLGLVRRTGRLLFLWGGLGALVGLLVLTNNISQDTYAGSAMHFTLSSLWMVLIVRAAFVHPALASLESRIAAGRTPNTVQAVDSPRRGFGPWLYLLLLLALPAAIAVLFAALGADVRILIIPRALPFVPLGAVFPCAMGVGFRKMGAAFRTALRNGAHTAADAEEAAGILRRCGFLALEMGAVGFVTNLISMLATIEDPSAIFGQFVLGLVPVLYAIYLVSALCFPLASRLEAVRSLRG